MQNNEIYNQSQLRREFDEIANQLEQYYGIFYALVSMGRPVFDDTINTACVGFNSSGENIEFRFNPKFWNEIDDYTKMFVICHECLHVILSHGKRSLDCPNHTKANFALDIVVNHMLTDRFGFDRSKVNDAEKYCWIDKVFNEKDAQDVMYGMNFEYYYGKLEEKYPDKHLSFDELMKMLSTVDSHETLPDFTESIEKQISKTIISRISDEELEELQDKLSEKNGKANNDGKTPSGSEKGRVGEPLVPGAIRAYLKAPRVYKKKWETVIYKWAKFATEEADVEQWIRRARRYSALNEELMLPTIAETESRSNKKLDVFFFLDCSGSCWHLKDRFFAAAKSLNPNRFNVRMFSRTTEVNEIDETAEITGGGSDDFRCIENHIQSELKKGNIKKYPDAVFHITDGHDCSGVKVDPEKPENWYTFLTDGGTDIWLPETSHTFKLKDFE